MEILEIRAVTGSAHAAGLVDGFGGFDFDDVGTPVGELPNGSRAGANAGQVEHANVAERTLRRAAREYFIFYSKLTPVVYTSVVGEGVQLTLRYLVAPRRVRGSEQDVWEAVLDRFAARDDIDLAYPTTRLYRNDLEGKPGAGGPRSET